nr:MAG TPA: hypothetical protein [Caudoviricetes sp.]
MVDIRNGIYYVIAQRLLMAILNLIHKMAPIIRSISGI